MADSVKIDKDLLDRVKTLIKSKPLSIKYSSAKQFIDIAVSEFLKKEEKGGNNE